jgi:hypothetical protein
MVADHQGGRHQGAVNHEISCALCILQSRSMILLLDFGFGSKPGVLIASPACLVDGRSAPESGPGSWSEREAAYAPSRGRPTSPF